MAKTKQELRDYKAAWSRNKYAKDPQHRENRRKYSHDKHLKCKQDPAYVEAINKKNLEYYYTSIRPFPDKMSKRRESLQKIQQRRRERLNLLKIELQQLIGGKCVNCGLTDPRLLDFDHINPLDKTMMISQKLHLPKEVLIEEVKKCQLLCPNCHRLKTIEQHGFDYRVRDYRNESRQSSFVGKRDKKD